MKNYSVLVLFFSLFVFISCSSENQIKDSLVEYYEETLFIDFDNPKSFEEVSFEIIDTLTLNDAFTFFKKANEHLIYLDKQEINELDELLNDYKKYEKNGDWFWGREDLKNSIANTIEVKKIYEEKIEKRTSDLLMLDSIKNNNRTDFFYDTLA